MIDKERNKLISCQILVFGSWVLMKQELDGLKGELGFVLRKVLVNWLLFNDGGISTDDVIPDESVADFGD
jgi:hypothetical protein